MITQLKSIETKDSTGEPSGILVSIWNSAFDSATVGQVYVTTILPGKMKGPHCHYRRGGAFTVLVGRVLIVTRVMGVYHEHVCGEGFKTVHVPHGIPAALYNIGSEVAFILNCPTSPWRDNSDEHTVADWDYEVRCAV